jgi:hypothetical protein
MDRVADKAAVLSMPDQSIDAELMDAARPPRGGELGGGLTTSACRRRPRGIVVPSPRTS